MSKTLILLLSYGCGFWAVGSMWSTAHKALEYHHLDMDQRRTARNYKIHGWIRHDLHAIGLLAALLMGNAVLIAMYNTLLLKSIGCFLVLLFFAVHYGLRYYWHRLIEQKPPYWAEQTKAVEKAQTWD